MPRTRRPPRCRRAVHDLPGGHPVARPEQPLDAEQIELLKLEYAAYLAHRPAAVRAGPHRRRPLAPLRAADALRRPHALSPARAAGQPGTLDVILLLALATVVLARWAAMDAWRAELVPLLLFGMTMAIVYRQELALLMSGVAGAGWSRWPSATACPVLPPAAARSPPPWSAWGSIRSRSKLIYVGLVAGGVAVAAGRGAAA